ncbi:MAG TPA: hypothetical protein PLH20_03370, partial [Flavobacterium sp.]|nr:hypothetical protein [Flavobacterium sp.]
NNYLNFIKDLKVNLFFKLYHNEYQELFPALLYIFYAEKTNRHKRIPFRSGLKNDSNDKLCIFES